MSTPASRRPVTAPVRPALALHSFAFRAMGTRCEIRLFARDAVQAAAAIHQAAHEIERLEDLYSRYRPGNFMDRLNQAAAAGGELEVHDECVLLMDYADACHQQSDGLFDISSGILRLCWDFQDGASPTPDPAGIERTLARVGWQHVRRDGRRVRFGRPGMQLDFGGIVKEYAVDRAAAVCRAAGIAHGVVEMGGDVAVLGPDPDGQPWVIAVQHPRQADATATRFALAQGALATSGDYARCVVIGGRRYSHILSPRTGWPVHGLASVTVMAERCVLAGSASTTAMLKESEGPAWLAELGLPHVWIDLEGRMGGTAPAEAAAEGAGRGHAEVGHGRLAA